MAARKDNKGRALRKGEFQRASDGKYVYVAGSADLNFLYDRYISTKSELRSTTFLNYTYMYNHYVRNGFGKKKIGEIKYSDVLQFYHNLLEKRGHQTCSCLGASEGVHELHCTEPCVCRVASVPYSIIENGLQDW